MSIQDATPRTGLRTGRVGLARVTKGGGQFRRKTGERLDLRHNQGQGNADVKFDAGGVIVRFALDLRQPPFILLELPKKHPFEVFRVFGKAEVIVSNGYVVWPKGLSTPLVTDDNVPVGQATVEGITGVGGIWLTLSYSVSQQSQTVADLGVSGLQPRLTVYRMNALTSVDHQFVAGTASPDPKGANSVNVMTNGELQYKLCVVDLIDGQAFVTDQIIQENIHPPEIVDAQLDPI